MAATTAALMVAEGQVASATEATAPATLGGSELSVGGAKPLQVGSAHGAVETDASVPDDVLELVSAMTPPPEAPAGHMACPPNAHASGPGVCRCDKGYAPHEDPSQGCFSKCANVAHGSRRPTSPE